MLLTIVLILQVITAIALITIVLLQQGKGAEAGASLGAGASQTVFGSSGSGNFMSKSTAVLAATFFAFSLVLAYLTKQQLLNDTSLNFEAVAPEINIPLEELVEPDLESGVESNHSDSHEDTTDPADTEIDSAFDSDLPVLPPASSQNDD